MEENGSEGICKQLVDCASAVRALYDQQILPQTCFMEGTMAIVCCNEKNSTEQKPPSVSKRDGDVAPSITPLEVTTSTKVAEITTQRSQRKPGFLSRQSA